ncbi:LrgB family protein [Heyndrickxia oleronia]|jgi:predicted murein hydrolase (TIGR00659 family)|uniref:CidB/LrgB family autolysis modulator n=1 Tax=Heyndrickxia oleronia TaxID=38875 RepID=A0A8E2IBH5_9BACI|nr:LrgB family protein [Heyndrickxia oleronia]NYV68006.1 LrgB family protein [Bacillus sp. Gen3]MBU5212277.1 LrgB family protein [Heyndrickxia oleronia]MCM3454653.1 LrgB family protein [Heyndrickxia oleronia]MDH5163739.1 LrgB family protein [Heyndrickxia oleronia]MEC1375131.1 LrgB family protein [Heyndrickxia oleronia]
MLILLFLILTASIYWGAKWWYTKKKKVYFSPLLLAPILIIFVLALFHISYDSYNSGAKWLTKLLQPATVALAIPLYRYYPILKKYLREILFSVLLGCMMSILASFSISWLVQLNKTLVTSIIPYSITTPIAMGVSSKIGGVPTITAVFVIMTGIIGMILGPWIIRIFGFKSEIARGVLLGTSSHGAGTSKALELSSATGAVSSVCMVLAAITSFCISPWIYMHILH